MLFRSALLLDHYFRRRKLRADVEIRVFTPEPYPLPVAGRTLGERMMELLASRGILFSPGVRLKRVDQQTKKLSFEDGSEASFDLLIATPVHQVPNVVLAAGLAQEGGWIPVDRGTLETRSPGVHAIGDVAGIMLTSIGKPLPKAGVLAHNEAEVVAHNIVQAITGKGERRQFTGNGECFVEPGDGRAGFGSGNFYADPAPQIRLRKPGVILHLGKVLYEKFWLYSRF